jgi:hypothetical protein
MALVEMSVVKQRYRAVLAVGRGGPKRPEACREMKCTSLSLMRIKVIHDPLIWFS